MVRPLGWRGVCTHTHGRYKVSGSHLPSTWWEVFFFFRRKKGSSSQGRMTRLVCPVASETLENLAKCFSHKKFGSPLSGLRSKPGVKPCPLSGAGREERPGLSCSCSLVSVQRGT